MVRSADLHNSRIDYNGKRHQSKCILRQQNFVWSQVDTDSLTWVHLDQEAKNWGQRLIAGTLPPAEVWGTSTVSSPSRVRPQMHSGHRRAQKAAKTLSGRRYLSIFIGEHTVKRCWLLLELFGCRGLYAVTVMLCRMSLLDICRNNCSGSDWWCMDYFILYYFSYHWYLYMDCVGDINVGLCMIRV